MLTPRTNGFTNKAPEPKAPSRPLFSTKEPGVRRDTIFVTLTWIAILLGAVVVVGWIGIDY